jgi:hypothetical protein
MGSLGSEQQNGLCGELCETQTVRVPDMSVEGASAHGLRPEHIVADADLRLVTACRMRARLSVL